MDMADVQKAVKAASEQLLDRAVADGLLTQEQADTIRQRGEDIGDRGPVGMLGMRGGFPSWPGGDGGFFPLPA